MEIIPMITLKSLEYITDRKPSTMENLLFIVRSLAYLFDCRSEGSNEHLFATDTVTLVSDGLVPQRHNL